MPQIEKLISYSWSASSKTPIYKKWEIFEGGGAKPKSTNKIYILEIELYFIFIYIFGENNYNIIVEYINIKIAIFDSRYIDIFYFYK